MTNRLLDKSDPADPQPVAVSSEDAQIGLSAGVGAGGEDIPVELAVSFPVIGVGASAGGLDAVTQMLRALPIDTGSGFVIIQHLAPDHASNLATILSRATAMPVCEARDEQEVQPDHVYVIPPGREMVIVGGKLQLLPQDRYARRRGIDCPSSGFSGQLSG